MDKFGYPPRKRPKPPLRQNRKEKVMPIPFKFELGEVMKDVVTRFKEWCWEERNTSLTATTMVCAPRIWIRRASLLSGSGLTRLVSSRLERKLLC